MVNDQIFHRLICLQKSFMWFYFMCLVACLKNVLRKFRVHVKKKKFTLIAFSII